VEEIVGSGGKTFILVLPKASTASTAFTSISASTAFAAFSLPTAREITSDREKFLITGNRRNFHVNLIPKNKSIKVNLVSKKFGIVYNTEGNEVGKRVYFVEVFEITGKGSIDITTVSDEQGTEDYKGVLILL
jgi:hypothetical protein